MAENKTLNKVRTAVKKSLQANTMISGPGACKLREAQAILQRASKEVKDSRIVRGVTRLSGVAKKTEDGKEEVHYQPAIIKTDTHLRLITDNYFKDANDVPYIRSKTWSLQSEIDREGLKFLPPREKISMGVEEPESFENKIKNLTEDMLDRAVPEHSAMQTAKRKVSHTASYDFPTHIFIHKPYISYVGGERSDTKASIGLEEFLAKAKKIIDDVVGVYQPLATVDNDYLHEQYIPVLANLADTLFKLFMQYPAGKLLEYQYRIKNAQGGEVLDAFREWLIVIVTNTKFESGSVVNSCDNPDIWKEADEQIFKVLMGLYPDIVISNYFDEKGSYSFISFDTSAVNFGLRVVYRQEWRSLGTQPGEIVRTIPLGPRQTEKVSTKVIVNQKKASTSEMVSSTESQSEAANTIKDSSEIVKEASRNIKWNTETSFTGEWIYFGDYTATASSGISGEHAASSKDTKSHLNESMVKTASKMRNESKVVVSLDKSSSQEYSNSSEITNPNDEVAVTYVYSKLQRQYEIYTKLAEVNSVVFVPEIVPAFEEINDEWIRKHDWILSKVLLDESFAEDLLLVINDETEEELSDKEEEFYYQAAQAAVKNQASYTSLQGNLPDIFIGPQEAYQKQMDKRRAIEARNKNIQKRKERLKNHIRTNILHYMRAIWSAEDPDHRLMRYSEIRVPTLWFPEVDKSLFNPSTGWCRCEYVPDYSSSSMRLLTDIIDPAGPIGYVGNYAVFYMRSDRDLSVLNNALMSLRTPYARFHTVVTPSQDIHQAFTFEPSGDDIRYKIKVNDINDWTVENTGTGFKPEIKVKDKIIQFDGIQIRFRELPKKGSQFDVHVFATGELQDPEMYEIYRRNPLPELQDEEEFFSRELLADMAYHFPDLEEKLIKESRDNWSLLSDETKNNIRDIYYNYLLKRDHTRQFLVDTNNLVIDIEMGNTSALEDFKRLHRSVDVMKEVEQYSKHRIENYRCKLRLDNNDLSDPDIENLTVVTSSKDNAGDSRQDPFNIIVPHGGTMGKADKNEGENNDG